MYTTKLRKVGGSIMLTLPPVLLDILHLQPGAQVDSRSREDSWSWNPGLGHFIPWTNCLSNAILEFRPAMKSANGSMTSLWEENFSDEARGNLACRA